MKYHCFKNNETEQLFKQNGLSQFEQIWTLDHEWFEPPNYRRNGWSGVIKYPLKDLSGQTQDVFIKRQENHNCKSLFHPIRGVPTFRREYLNINRLNKKNIPTLTDLYYGERIHNNHHQSILITRSLDGYESFEDFFQPDRQVPEALTAEIMQLTGKITRLLHNARFRHGSLYPKHFFILNSDNQVDVRIIDLEKLKWYPLKRWIRFNDISRIIRHRAPLSKHAIEILLDSYLAYGTDLRQSAYARNLYDLLNRE
jgi:hypothetical protein